MESQRKERGGGIKHEAEKGRQKRETGTGGGGGGGLEGVTGFLSSVHVMLPNRDGRQRKGSITTSLCYPQIRTSTHTNHADKSHLLTCPAIQSSHSCRTHTYKASPLPQAHIFFPPPNTDSFFCSFWTTVQT